MRYPEVKTVQTESMQCQAQLNFSLLDLSGNCLLEEPKIKWGHLELWSSIGSYRTCRYQKFPAFFCKDCFQFWSLLVWSFITEFCILVQESYPRQIDLALSLFLLKSFDFNLSRYFWISIQSMVRSTWHLAVAGILCSRTYPVSMIQESRSYHLCHPRRCLLGHRKLENGHWNNVSENLPLPQSYLHREAAERGWKRDPVFILLSQSHVHKDNLSSITGRVYKLYL